MYGSSVLIVSVKLFRVPRWTSTVRPPKSAGGGYGTPQSGYHPPPTPAPYSPHGGGGGYGTPQSGYSPTPTTARPHSPYYSTTPVPPYHPTSKFPPLLPGMVPR